jgi:CHAT domain-containing protein
MTVLPALFAATLCATAAQDTSQVQSLVALAATGPQAALVDQVGRHPDAAREALHDLLRQSVGATGNQSPQVGSAGSTEALESAERVAQAYFEAWTDGFLLQEVRRFAAWPPGDRQVKLAADSLRLAGNEAYAREGIAAAMKLWRRSLAYSERLHDAAGAAKSLGNIGAGFFGAGNPDSARVYLSAAYTRAASVSDLRTAASALTNVANIDFEDGDLPGAAERYAQAVDILARTGEHRFLSAAQHNLALLSMAMGNFKSARAALGESIRLSRLHGYPDDEAEGLSSLADVAIAEGEYGEAAELLDRALELSRTTGNQAAAAGTLHSMGLLSMARGDYPKALGLLGQALARYSDLGRLTDAIAVREDAARARVAVGDLRGGLRELQTASRVADSVDLGPLRAADLALTAADLNLALNQFPRARELFRQAQGLYRGVFDEAGQAAAIEGEGYLSLVRGDGSEAMALLEKALGLRTRPGNSDPRAEALGRLYLAAAQEQTGDIGGARRSLSLARQGLGALGDVVGEAAVLATLGGLEARAGAFHTADSLYRTGLDLLGSQPAPEIAWRLHAGRAEIVQGSGDLEAAARELRLAITAIEGAAETLRLVEQRTAFRADKAGVYHRLSEVELRLGDVAAAFEASERIRVRQSFAAIGRGRVTTPAMVPPELFSREQDRRQQIVNLTAQLRSAGLARPELREPAAAVSRSPAEVRSALARAQTEYAELLKEMRAASPGYSAVVDPVPVSIADVAARLQPDQTLVEYLVADSVTIAFVVTRDTAAALVLDIGSGTLGDLVDFARGTMARRGRSDPGQLWRTPLERLHRHLIGPLEDAGLLDAHGSLVIVPHRELHYLPFEALLQSIDGKFLAERYDVSYAPSASTWSRMVDQGAGRPAAPRNGSTRASDFRMLALAPRVDQLPGSRYEVEVVGRLFGDGARVLVGDEATEEAFRKAAPQFDIVHLATFGVLNKANPLFSHVELADAPGDLGLLETHEVFGLGLRARLLTLSACETAVGSGTRWDLPSGDDWVSLGSAFLAAGADNVLASLWQVEDLATAELMQRFYRHLTAGMSLAGSLAAAQRELIANPDTAHPFYWAGFVLVGAGGGVQ